MSLVSLAAAVQPRMSYAADKSTPSDQASTRAFFAAMGQRETIAPGTVLFRENERIKDVLVRPVGPGLFAPLREQRMYFLHSGTVTLTAFGRAFGSCGPGSMFGEIAVSAEMAGASRVGTRLATATAVSECEAYSLSARQLREGLARNPAFALTVMGVMFQRLRFIAERVRARRLCHDGPHDCSEPTLDDAAMTRLLDRFGRPPVVPFAKGGTILKERRPGTRMYVVLEGRVNVAIGGALVEKLQPGCTFGEMSLLDQLPRTASAWARTDCALLSIGREEFIDWINTDPTAGVALLGAAARRAQYCKPLVACAAMEASRQGH